MSKIGFNPWISIWTKPKSTIRKIVDYDPNYRLFLLSMIYGFITLVGLAQTFGMGSFFKLPMILIFCVLISPLYGYLMFSICSFFMLLAGKLLKGKALYRHIRIAVAWATVPMIVNVFSWLILLFMFKSELFKKFPVDSTLSSFQVSFLFFILMSQLFFNIWSLVLYVNNLAEVQKFSIGKAILNIIVAILMFLVITYIVAMIFYFLKNNFLHSI